MNYSYLIIAIICSVSVSVLLKILRKRRYDIRQTILAGYPIAFLLTWLLLQPDLSSLAELFKMSESGWLIILLGMLLPTIFVVLGVSLNRTGIIATDAAQRLSLILPIIASVIIFGEHITPQRSIGIGLGFLALLALVYQTRSYIQPSSISQSKPAYLWLLGVWLGYGVIDILFKQVAKQGSSFATLLWAIFLLAGLFLLGYLLVKRVKWEWSALAMGVVLGALNFGNIYAYVKAHQALSDSPSIVFTGMNVGVIALATIVGAAFFKEKINWINGIGLLFAIACVFTLFF